ncbi:MAG: DNA mismatch repair protein MutL, partial [Oscillibacter sp.]|nr:DNA mismatch repair protein MutL [Oscillibacter sp.]
TPARLKFMKKDAAEGAAVFAVVQRVALSHPEVSVKFIRDGKQEMLTPGDGQLQSAVYAVLGRDLALGFRPVKSSGEDMTVTGFVSLPACCRGSRNWQFFFVNGRQVKSRIMMAALEEAYKNQKMVGKFPGCVLHLETKLNAVDVNVHPAKTEVKFGNERQVFSAVYHAVLSALEGDRSHPAAVLGGKSAAPQRPAAVAKDEVTHNQTKITIAPAQKPAVSQPTVRVQDNTYKAQPAAPVQKPAAPQSRPSFTYVHTPIRTQPAPAPVTKAAPVEKAVEKVVERPMEQPPVPMEEAVQDPVIPTPVAAVPETQTGAQCSRSSLERTSSGMSELFPNGESEGYEACEDVAWRLAGEVLNTYIVVEQGDTVYFIDKHAAHERMNFDRMKAEGYDPMAQTLLSPVVCRMPAEEQAALLAQLPLLEEFGFDVDELGGSLVVRQAPFDVPVEEIPVTLSEIAQKLLEGGKVDPAAARDEMLHTMACKAAIKGGWKTSPQELERVAQAVMSGQVKYCPHGRPVAIELTKKELEKQFKRI